MYQNPLLKLLALNKAKGQPLRAEAGADESTIYLYDVIVQDDYWGGVSAMSFIKQLIAIDSPIIHVRINSPGGDVFAALAMAQAMREHKAKIIAHIDGYAASAATFPAIAANETVITTGGMFMIHNAWTIAAGNANDFAKTADLLNKTDASIADLYAKKCKMELADIRAAMDAETYYFGQEAVDAGFVDRMADESVSNKIDWDLSAYNNAPNNSKEPKNAPKPPKTDEKPDLSNHYRRLELVNKLAA